MNAVKSHNGKFAEFKERIGHKKWKRIRNFLFTLPFLIHIFIFSYVPLIGWLYSVFEYKQGRLWWDVEWVGLKYFIKILGDDKIPGVLLNTLAFSFIGLATSFIPPLFAVLLNEFQNQKGKKVIQTITTFPNFIGWIIVFGIAQPFFSATGVVNDLLKLLGLPVFQFGLIGDKEHVWIFQWFLGLWKSLGWGSILYLAAISGIDGELYDAAKVDGANRVQLIRHITFPGLAATYIVQMVLAISNLLNSGFEQYYLFRNPMTASKIDVLDYYIYQQGIGSGNFSYAVAAGIMKSIVSILLLGVGNQIAKKLVGHKII